MVQRRKENSGKDETVVKFSLQSRLLLKPLLPEIQKYVFNTSQAIHKCSLVFNRLLLHCLSNNIELPDLTDITLYTQCMKVGRGTFRKDNDILQFVWDNFFINYPCINSICGDSQVYTYATKTYMTNFKNSLVFAFQGRQKKFVKSFLKRNNFDLKLVYAVTCKINNFECKTQVPDELDEFIQFNKHYLQLEKDEHVTKTWLGTHMGNVVSYYYHILKYLEQFNDEKLFTLAPISKIKSHYITIDSTMLYFLLNNINQMNKISRKDFKEIKNEQWSSCFNLNVKGSSKKFTNIVQTDGTSICIHYRRDKRVKVGGKRELRLADRVIAIDPGRTNLIYGVEDLGNNEYKKYILTRKTYYNQCGMTKANKKAKKWEKDIETEEKIYSQVSLKTTNEENWKKFIQNYISVYDTLWEEKTKNKRAQQRFRTYRLKQKCLDKFFASMNPKGSIKPVIAYGAAKFNPTSTSELSAPTCSLSKKCATFYPTAMVDEFRTTKICYNCDCQLHPVAKQVEVVKTTIFPNKFLKLKVEKTQLEDREIRGLRWCSSTKCRTFKNRDMNAALNILRCFKAGTNRAEILTRNSDVALEKIKSLRIH